jgi:hypothetical protein
MSSLMLFPKFKSWLPSGAVNAGGKVNTYTTGTSNPLTTYQDGGLTLANANPVILDANGEAIIYTGPLVYKIVITDSAGGNSQTIDPYSPNLAFPSPPPSDWIQLLNVVTQQPVIPIFGSATGFTFNAGADMTGLLSVGRRIKTQNTAGIVTSTITNISYAAPNNTVTVANDATLVLDSGLSSIYYGINSYPNAAAIGGSFLDPRTALLVTKSGTQTGFGAATKIATWTKTIDQNSEWVGGSNRWVCRYPGLYVVTTLLEVSDTVATQLVKAFVYKNGADQTNGGFPNYTHATANNHTTIGAQVMAQLVATDFIEAFLIGTANTSVYGGPSSMMITRVP